MGATHKNICLTAFALLLPQCCCSPLPDAAFLEIVAEQSDFPLQAFTVSGTHFAQGYTTEDATNLSVEGMEEDCDNINMNNKLSSSFRSDVFGPGMQGFFYKCEKVGDKNKYWFTISVASIGSVIKLCDNNTVYPIVYDEQHNTYWHDEPFTCDGAPSFAMTWAHSAFLGSVAKRVGLPANAYTVSGTHFAQGYTAKDATTISEAGMKEDCDNINFNKKLSASFRMDVFSTGLKGFFYKCEKVGDKNKYWFTISTSDHSNVMKLCDKNTVYPIVYDDQHETYWRDEPFTCMLV